MKKLGVILFGLLCVLSVSGQVNASGNSANTDHFPLPKVDKRTELLSIVFRLAGNPEYNQGMYKEYVKDIHNHFDRYKDHELIRFARELYQKSGVSFDAVMTLAIYLSQPPRLDPIIPFTDAVPEARWGKKNAEKFVGLLKKFYIDADCATFFSNHEAAYQLAQERFKVVYNALDIKWYQDFYGTAPKGSLNIIVGLGNGACNYGAKVIYPDGREDPYAVMGTWSFDDAGKPVYSPQGYLPTLIHEFNHSFVNHLVEQHAKDFEQSGNVLFKTVGNMMSRQAYPRWDYMEKEALVRASVVRYLMQHNTDNQVSSDEIKSQIGNGFIWTGDLVDLLGIYEHSRDQYPTLESFLPRLISFYDDLANHDKALFSRCPQVSAIEPFKNDADRVSSDIKEMKIVFDKPLTGEGFSIWMGQKGADHFPVTKNGVKYADNNTSIVLTIDLKPNTDYELILVGQHFKSADGYPLIDYPIHFKTKK